MKKALLAVILFFAVMSLAAQNRIQLSNDGSQVSVDATNAPLPVVTQTPPGKGSSEPDTSKRMTIWLESGNGFFTTDPAKPAPFSVSQLHNPFLLFTRLYDTTKDLRIIVDNTHTADGTSSGGGPYNQYLGESRIKIIPNVYDIVPGDTMAFALVYRSMSNPASATTPIHKLYFFYNDNISFDSLTSNSMMVTGGGIPFCRMHYGEEADFPAPPAGLSTGPGGEQYNNCIVFTIPEVMVEQGLKEKNLFVSLVAKDKLEYGGSGSVYAVLTDASGNVIGTDLIPDMRFAPAHDPNYIVQKPGCLLLPKKAASFTYTVHFQNTGAGDADSVKMLVHLPKGMDWSSFNPASGIVAAKFAGKKVQGNDMVITPDPGNNILQVLFKPVDRRRLVGTQAINPATNPVTMGEITFTIRSTPNTEDSLQAYAEIYFHSVNPSIKAQGNDGQYEDPVLTKMATTYYKKCCVNCPDPVPGPGCHKIIGLCWWWWVLILLALLLILFVLVRRRRKCKKEAEEETTYRS